MLPFWKNQPNKTTAPPQTNQNTSCYSTSKKQLIEQIRKKRAENLNMYISQMQGIKRYAADSWRYNERNLEWYLQQVKESPWCRKGQKDSAGTSTENRCEIRFADVHCPVRGQKTLAGLCSARVTPQFCSDLPWSLGFLFPLPPFAKRSSTQNHHVQKHCDDLK